MFFGIGLHDGHRCERNPHWKVRAGAEITQQWLEAGWIGHVSAALIVSAGHRRHP